MRKTLKNIGISKKKNEYILNFYNSIVSKSINFNLLKSKNEDEIKKQLTSLKGIGNWTCDMILIFFFVETQRFS